MMTHEEAEAVADLWRLKYYERWQLYRLWLDEYISIQEHVMLRYQTAYETLSRQRKEVDQEEDYFILKKANVVGLTTTGAAKHRHLLQRVCPRIIVVEEAAEVLEAHIITTLSKECEHLILIGDHQQLRPNPTVYRLAKQFNLDVSLFERMINNGLPYYRLGIQHRMRPEISILMKEHFYDGLDDHQSVMDYKPVMGVKTNMFFLEHNHKELKNDDNKSKSNMHEAKFLVALCRYFLQQGYDPSRITILTTYTGQLFNFKKLMKKDEFEGVRVSVVDNYQGEENDIILLSLVRSNEEGSIGFLKISNRVCVALSRAKVGLFCIGNVKLLAEQSDLWKKIVNTTSSAGQVGQQLSLVCQNHPETVTDVSSAEDFAKVPDGGCTIRCGVRLDCGHACRFYCHPRDPYHEEYMCMKNCTTICPRGHACILKCYAECNCQVLLKKLFVACQHSYMVKCHELETAVCQRPCQKRLPSCKHPCPSICGEICPKKCIEHCQKKISCGHRCPRRCGKPCLTRAECNVPIEIQLPKCGHTYIVPCCDDPKLKTLKRYPVCNQRCNKTLKCGHVCQRLCKDRCETNCQMVVEKTWDLCNHSTKMKCHITENAICNANCSRNLPCGHPCKMKCKDTCDPTKCISPCTKTLLCGHQCQKKCNEDCETICQRETRKELDCGHFITVPCWEDVKGVSCVRACNKPLPCGHLCKNICGMTCTEICIEDTVKTIAACGHSITVSCSNTPKHWLCKLKCQTRFQCGHLCPRECGQICVEKCSEIVNKQLPDCKHITRAPCAIDPRTLVCHSACDITLACGHKCAKTCREPCTQKCEKVVTREHPICGHKLNLLCHENVALKICREPCKTKLPCGHDCPKMCFEPCKTVTEDASTNTLPTNQENSFKSQIVGSFQFDSEEKSSRARLKWPLCMKQVTKPGTCGHQIKVFCYETPNALNCKGPCKKLLVCGHTCPLLCSSRCESAECQVTVWKSLPMCKHKMQMRCCQDPKNVICQEPCLEKLPCGHQCKKLCYEACQSTVECHVDVTKLHPGCNHMVQLPCSKEPSTVSCVMPCKKQLSCGHICPNPCWQPCESGRKCTVKVPKEIRKCRHIAKLPCHLNPDSGMFCTKKCSKELKCGHTCKEKCGAPCTKKCKEVSPVKILPCKHLAKKFSMPC